MINGNELANCMVTEDDFADHHNYHSEIAERQWQESLTPEEKIIEELTGYMETIKYFDKDSAQDATALHAYLVQLTNYMARANLLMAEYNKKFREEKEKAYQKLMISSHAQQKYYSVTLAKDYVDSQCSESGYIYDLAERTSRLCNHTEKVIITIVSSLKSERQFANYAT